MRLAFHIGAVDQPVDRSVHLKPMPRLGGLGMVLSILVGMAMFLNFEPVIVAFMAGFLAIAITGLIDDIYQIRASVKMLGQLIACLLFIELSGVSLTSFGDLLGLGDISFSGPLSYLITLFCMVGVINAFNLSDGLDGLVAGIVVIACFFLGFLALTAHAWIGLSIIVVLFGGVLGFLKFNSYPARLFMGDTGSLMLGFSIASISVILASCESKGIQPISIAIILALPIIDTIWVMTRRIMQGKSPMSPDRTHLHHRLLALGFSHPVVVTILYAWLAMFGALALSLKGMPEYWQFGFAIALSAGLYSLLTLCERRNICMVSGDSNGSNDPSDLNRRLAGLLGQSMKLFPYIIVLGLLLPLLIADSIPMNLSRLALALAAFVALAFPWRDYHEHLNIVYGLFYLCGFTILYAWNISTYQAFNLHQYMFLFAGLLLVWALLKVKFKRHSEVFLTSSFELLLIFISWFIPFLVLPALEVPDSVMHAAKASCLVAIPLLIAMKLVIKRQPQRNRDMAIGLILMLCFIALRAFQS